MQVKQGDIIEGIVTRITKYGAFVTSGDMTGMIHISEISKEFVSDINEYLKINQTVKTTVIGVGENGRLALSLKRLPDTNKGSTKPTDFESMLSKFKRDSDERMSGLKSLEPKKTQRSNKNKK